MWAPIELRELGRWLLWIDRDGLTHDSSYCLALGKTAAQAVTLTLVPVEEAIERRLPACRWCFPSARS